MSQPQKAKRSIAIRLLALVGWITIKTSKIACKVLAFAGFRLARRRLDELNARSAERSTAQQMDHDGQVAA